MVIKNKHIVWTAVILILLVLTGIGLWYYLRPTDENLIRARFSRLSELASKTTKEGALPAAGKAKEMAGLFSDKALLPWTDWTGWPVRLREKP